MDHGSTPSAVAPHLYAVKKTLRRLYLPSREPNAAIDQALAALARLEPAQSTEPYAAALAPAA